MSNSSEREKPGSGREQRLGAALRENLKRRKAQAKGRASAQDQPDRDAESQGNRSEQDK